jgi:hypothetical protein
MECWNDTERSLFLPAYSGRLDGNEKINTAEISAMIA